MLPGCVGIQCRYMCRDEGTCRGVTIQVRHVAWHDTRKGQCLQNEKVGPVSFSLNQPCDEWFADRDNFIRLMKKPPMHAGTSHGNWFAQ